MSASPSWPPIRPPPAAPARPCVWRRRPVRAAPAPEVRPQHHVGPLLPSQASSFLVSSPGARVYELENLSLRGMTECGAQLRSLHTRATSMEDVCTLIVRYLYDVLRAGDERACVMVRAYKTHASDELEPELRTFAERAAGQPLQPGTRCLTLMATAG